MEEMMTINGRDIEIRTTFSSTESPKVLEIIPVYSAGIGSFGDGGVRDLYKIEVEVEFKISAEWSIFEPKVERSYKRTITTYVEYRASKSMPKSLYRPSLWIRPELWENAPTEIINIIKESNDIYVSLEKERDEFYEREKTAFIEELLKVVPPKEEVKEESPKSSSDSEESIGDYNSRFGVTSTWSGDAGWMDDD